MSEQQGDNMKNRELYCPKCHIYSWSDESNPFCRNCASPLIKVVYDAISGHRITGELK